MEICWVLWFDRKLSRVKTTKKNDADFERPTRLLTKFWVSKYKVWDKAGQRFKLHEKLHRRHSELLCTDAYDIPFLI